MLIRTRMMHSLLPHFRQMHLKNNNRTYLRICDPPDYVMHGVHCARHDNCLLEPELHALVLCNSKTMATLEMEKQVRRI